jgi:hypothetical protein
MKKKLLLAAVSLVLLVGLQACSTNSTISTPRQGIVYPQKLAIAIEDTGAKAAVLVNEKGQLSFYDTKGEPLGACVLPGSESSLPVCKGFTKEHTIIGIEALPILETKGSGCITFGPDASGFIYQICW